MSAKTQRLDKFLAATTDLTRSLAKKALHRGEVTVDGEVVKDAAMQVSETSRVCWQDELLQLHSGYHYLVLNKPVGYECSSKSSHHPLVSDLLGGLPGRERIQPVGRLDVTTSGLLLMTDDGQWSHRITSPRYQKRKIYRALLAEPLVSDAEERLQAGLQLEGEDLPTRSAELQRLDGLQVRLILTEGRYHQVRRMFAALGNHVVTLHREAVGDLELDEQALPAGQWRELTPQEVAGLSAGPN